MPKRSRTLVVENADLFSADQLKLLEKISDDKSYTEPQEEKENAKYVTGFERLLNRALSTECTVQDLLNLGVMATKMKNLHSKGKVTELGADFYGGISAFCNEITGLESEKDKFQYFTDVDFLGEKPGYKKKSMLRINSFGYVILSDEQKLQLLDFREKIVHTNQYLEGFGDAGLMRSEYNTFTYEAGSELKVNINSPSTESDFIDRKAGVTALSSVYALNNPMPVIRKAPRPQAAAPKGDPKRSDAVEMDLPRLSAYKITDSDSKVSELREAWKAMKSHTPGISLFNSTEFNNMEKAFKAYITAYDNIKAGRSVDGKIDRREKNFLEHDDIVKFKKLQDDMQKAAKAYTDAKRAQKGGGIDKHSTRQGMDRLAMADALQEFDLFPKPKVDKGPLQPMDFDKINVKKVKLEEIDDSPKRGREKLNKHITKLQNKELENKDLGNNEVKKNTKKKL